jgi:hypothetical protein
MHDPANTLRSSTRWSGPCFVSDAPRPFFLVLAMASPEERPSAPPQGFVPIITGPSPIAAAGRAVSTAPVIEVKLAGAVIRQCNMLSVNSFEACHFD